MLCTYFNNELRDHFDRKREHLKTFFIIWAGQAFSVFGSAAAQFAIIWWLTVQTGSAAVLAAASIVGLLPQAVIGPFAGAWIDRLSRKTVMIAADFLVAAASLAWLQPFCWAHRQYG